MNQAEESKYLDCILKQMDPGQTCIFCTRLAGVILWVIVGAVVFGLIKLDDSLPLWATLGVSMITGALIGMQQYLKLATKNWPILRPHVSRESIERRIAELGV